MSEITAQVSTYQTNYQCDQCKQANIILDPEFDTVIPIHYICPNCQATYAFLIRYPFLTYQ